MKIAICYSGSTRTFEHCVKSHAALIPEADVYISTWSDPQRIDKVAPPWYERLNIEVPEKISYEYLKKCLPANFRPIKILVDDYFDCPPEFEKYNGLFYQYFQIKRCFDLIDKQYDLIVRLRMDIDLKSFPENPSLDKLTFDPFVWADDRILNKKINEMIWIGNTDLMRKSVGITDNLAAIKTTIAANLFFGESICYHHLIREQLMENVGFFEFGYKVWR